MLIDKFRVRIYEFRVDLQEVVILATPAAFALMLFGAALSVAGNVLNILYVTIAIKLINLGIALALIVLALWTLLTASSILPALMLRVSCFIYRTACRMMRADTAWIDDLQNRWSV